MYISEFEKVSPCLLRLSIFFSGIPKKLQKSEIFQSLPARFSNLEAGPIRMDRADGEARNDCKVREGKSRFLQFLGYNSTSHSSHFHGHPAH